MFIFQRIDLTVSFDIDFNEVVGNLLTTMFTNSNLNLSLLQLYWLKILLYFPTNNQQVN